MIFFSSSSYLWPFIWMLYTLSNVSMVSFLLLFWNIHWKFGSRTVLFILCMLTIRFLLRWLWKSQ